MHRVLLALSFVAVLAVGRAPAAEQHRYLPDDTEIVVSLNFKQVVNSKVFKDTLLGPVKDLLKSDDVRPWLEQIGLDPLNDLHRVLIASPGSTEIDRGLIIVQGVFDPAKFKANADDLAKTGVKRHQIVDGAGGMQGIYEFPLTGQQFPWFVCVPAKDTVLISPGKDYIVDALKRNPLKNPAGLKNKNFQDVLDKVDDKQSVYVAATAEALGRLGLPDGVTKELFQKLDGLAGGFKLEESLDIEFVLGCRNVDDARSLHRTINTLHTQGLLVLGLLANQDPGVETALDVLKAVRFATKDRTVTLKGRIDADIIQGWLKGGQ